MSNFELLVMTSAVSQKSPKDTQARTFVVMSV